MTDALASGRRSFQRGAWADAHDHLVEADGREPLGIDDLERLAVAAFLVGEEAERVAVWARAHQECVQAGDRPRAARCAFWLAFGLLLRGEMAPAEGWLARGQRTLDEADIDCVERGFLLVPAALGRLVGGDAEGALATFTAALEVGQRFADRDLVTFGRLGRGQALVFSGRRTEGVGELDEAMVAVIGGEVSPPVAGLVYCAVIDTCRMIFDLRRAHEWTAALTRWCEAQPELVAYRGQCLVHRAEILQLHGDWPEAMEVVERAYEQLSRPPAHPAIGEALYGLAELLRLRGDLDRSEDAYRRASEHGRDPQPGLARLRLAQGQTTVAVAAVRRAVAESGPDILRAELLAAAVEILLVAGDLDGAGEAAGELGAIAAGAQAPVLQAMAAHAAGSVALGAGEPAKALGELRAAWLGWRDLGAPYAAARTRVAIGLACRALGDDDGADLELDAAERAFGQLGAPTDLADVARLRGSETGALGLTAREREVLTLVATGATNRAIAVELTISEKTVARHVANIFTKLGLSSRAAATAYAYEHHLVRSAYTE